MHMTVNPNVLVIYAISHKNGVNCECHLQMHMTVNPNVLVIYAISHKNGVNCECHLQLSSMTLLIFITIMWGISNG